MKNKKKEWELFGTNGCWFSWTAGLEAGTYCLADNRKIEFTGTHFRLTGETGKSGKSAGMLIEWDHSWGGPCIDHRLYEVAPL